MSHDKGVVCTTTTFRLLLEPANLYNFIIALIHLSSNVNMYSALTVKGLISEMHFLAVLIL